jgi:anti-sigma-K factor RskA
LRCEDYDDRLIELALGTLPQDQAGAVRAHLAAGCPRCAGRLAELSATLAMLPLALPATDAPTGVRQRLLLRTRESSNARNAQSVPPPHPGRWRIGPVAGGAIAAAALIAIGAAWMREQQSVTQLTSQLNEREQQISDLRDALATEQETARAIRSPSSLMVSLEGAARSSGEGRIFIDPALGKWWFAARGLKPLPSGKTYEFWLIPDGQKPVAAGTFDVDAAGVGYLTGRVPANIGATALAAVTDEPTGGVPQPTGQIQIKGAIGR